MIRRHAFLYLSVAAYLAVYLNGAVQSRVYSQEQDEYSYEARGKRDPFVPLIGSDRSALIKLEDVVSVDDLRLEGLATGPDGSFRAILNGELVKVNDKIGDVEIKKIDRISVTLLVGGKEYNINLPGEGGDKE